MYGNAAAAVLLARRRAAETGRAGGCGGRVRRAVGAAARGVINLSKLSRAQPPPRRHVPVRHPPPPTNDFERDRSPPPPPCRCKQGSCRAGVPPLQTAAAEFHATHRPFVFVPSVLPAEPPVPSPHAAAVPARTFPGRRPMGERGYAPTGILIIGRDMYAYS